MFGIIPAYAGSTSYELHNASSETGSSPHTRGAPIIKVSREICLWDHPRIRGEHFRLCFLDFLEQGIIPAYAGSTYESWARMNSSVGSSPHTRGALHAVWDEILPVQDHPRIRGEHRRRRRRRTDTQGSSPHTRGAPYPLAIASSTSMDHPRIRGEHPARIANLTAFDRIIPAYAGSTLRLPLGCEVVDGSSPHTRGAQQVQSRPGCRGRIIPAYAGSTFSRTISPISPGDHPRIRGEHCL